MARLVGVDLPRDKRMAVALTYIYGVGRTQAAKALEPIAGQFAFALFSLTALRAAQPSQEDMERMLQAEDLAQSIKLVCDLPQRAAIQGKASGAKNWAELLTALVKP